MDNKILFRYFMQLKDQLQLLSARKSAFIKVAKLKAEYFFSPEPVAFEERLKHTFAPIKVGDVWCNEPYSCGWFHFTGEVPQSAKGQHVVLLIDIGGEGCVYSPEGEIVCGLTNVTNFTVRTHLHQGKKLVEVAGVANGNEKIDIWVDAASNKMPTAKDKRARLKEAYIAVERTDIASLYYDYMNLAMLKPYCKSADPKRRSLNNALKQARKNAFWYSREGVAKARQILAEEAANGEQSEYTIYAVGHGHLDLAYEWPIRETKRKAVRTFSNQLLNIQNHNNYIFLASQPQQFVWVKEGAPKLFEKIKEAVQNGNIEAQGSMWVESDCNLPCGESLIRQNLYGKRYFKEEFGKDIDMCWLPDCFGFNGNLPQILAKCGIKYFSTTKMSWNNHNLFPHSSFIWEGVDGSRLLAHFPPEQSYSGEATPYTNKEALKQFIERDITKDYAVVYGVGDGGGGPSDGHIQTQKRQFNTSGLPRVRFATMESLFDKLSADADKLPIYKGELYLERHQGTYTTVSKLKNFNRRIEFALHNVEFLLAALKGGYDKDYRAELDEIWKEVLLYQFHDVLPGSSIMRVYEECLARYPKLLERLEAVKNELLPLIEGSREPSAINYAPFAAKEIVKYAGKLYYADVPAYSAAPLKEYVLKDTVKATDCTLENEYFWVKFDSTGNIMSVVDKMNKKEFVADYFNKLVVFEDSESAWDIKESYVNDRPMEFKLLGSSFSVKDGSAVRENIYRLNTSTITQRIILTEGKPLIEFCTTVDWNPVGKMLRAEFRPTVFADEVTCDVQMANVKRSTKDETKLQKAQFEICAHKWIDLSNDGYGVSFITEAKYGWRVKNGLVSLNLLRSSMFPATSVDKGMHSIKYAVYPHKGDYKTADTAAYAYTYNNPPELNEHTLKLSPFVATDKKNVVIETVKPSEDLSGTVLRLYESFGEHTVATATINRGYEAVCETDMLENVIKPTSLTNLEFAPFEIKTLLIK